MPSTVPHLLLDEDGSALARAEFGPAVRWNVGDQVVLGALERYRVLERRDPAPGHETVVLVVERT